MSSLIAFAVALAVTAGLLPAVIRLARRLGAVDRPGGRRVHCGAVPRLGGIGIVLGVGCGIAASLIVAGRVHTLGQTEQYPWYGPALGMAIVFVGGLLDDLHQFSARIKFQFQVLAAAVAVAGGVTIDAVTIPGFGTLQMGFAAPLIALAWILVVTNAMNLIDGLDGLAGGLALIVAITVAAVAAVMGQFAMVICSFALAGALVGFLIYNFNPAQVFMGDGGSQFLGFMIAIISIRGSQKGPTAVAITVPLLVMGVPLLDLATTIARRARTSDREPSRGFVEIVRRVARADRKHLHHNLLDHGFSPRRAVIALYLVAALFGLSGYLSVARNSLPVALLTLVLSVGCVLAIKLVPARAKELERADTEVGR